MKGRIGRWFALVGASLMVSAAWSQAPARDAQNPAPILSLDIEAGYRSNLRRNGKSEGYYRVAWNGALVREAGAPLKSARHLDLAQPPQTTEFSPGHEPFQIIALFSASLVSLTTGKKLAVFT